MSFLGGERGQTATPSHQSKDHLVDIFAIPAVAAVLGLAYAGLQALTLLVEPLAGEASAALAVVIVTVIVRLALIPVGISQVKAEWTRRRLAPKLAALQRKYTKKPELLQRKTLELYRDENASPLAGLLPVLAQAPVLGVVYTLFIRATINGHANALLAHQLFGAPLGMSLLQAISTGTWAGLAAFAAVLLIMAVVPVARLRGVRAPRCGAVPRHLHRVDTRRTRRAASAVLGGVARCDGSRLAARYRPRIP
jgi:YidC/Oxa1 family membrane protein insertase